MSETATINEERLFSKLPFFFDQPSSVLLELAQNSQRSKATMMNLSLNDGVLTVSDDGEGCNNPKALLVLSESSWNDQQLMRDANPAGWGLMFLICLAEEVSFRSNFGSLTVDAERFLSDGDYRRTVYNDVHAEDSCNGFYLSARLKDKTARALMEHTDKLKYFPLDITINEKPLERTTIGAELKKMHKDCLQLDYQGNHVYIIVSPDFPRSSRALREDHLGCIWYGIPIKERPYHNAHVYIDVATGSPLTPILPYRTDVREDDKLTAFYEFVRDEVVKFCTEQINGYKDLSDTSLISMMKTMSAVARQKELDILERFHYRIFQQHNREDSFGMHTNFVIGKSDPPPISEILNDVSVTDITGNAISYDLDELVLPEYMFTVIHLPEARPYWLHVEEKHFTITVQHIDAPKVVNYDWVKAKITCQGKAIQALAFIRGWDEGAVFFSNDAKDAYDIQYAIFECVYDEGNWEGDSRDTQKYNFEQCFDQDIMRVTGKYNRRDLLSGFETLGLRMEKAASIAINKSMLVIKYADGSRKHLKIA